MQDPVSTLSGPFFFPFSHHPRFIVTAVWQSVSKHQIHCVLLCGVNNTESSTRPQSVNRDGDTSNSTAAAIFITKTCTWRQLLRPTSLPPTVVLSPLFSFSSCFPSLHVCHCNPNHMCVYVYICTYKYTDNNALFQHVPASYSIIRRLRIFISHVCSVCPYIWQQPLCAIVWVLSQMSKELQRDSELSTHRWRKIIFYLQGFRPHSHRLEPYVKNAALSYIWMEPVRQSSRVVW